MSILNFDQPPGSPQLLRPLIHALMQLNFYSVTQINPRSANFYFSGLIALNRAKQYLHANVLAKIVRDREIKLEVRLNAEACVYTRWLLQFFHKRLRQLCHYVHITNLLQLSERQGVFRFSESSGNLAYQTYLHGVFAVSEAKRAALLGGHLRKMLRTYCDVLEHIVFYYRIPGFNLNQLQLMLQEGNAVQLKPVSDKILLLKSCFDELSNQKQKRPSRQEQYEQQVKQLELFVSGINPFQNNSSTSLRTNHTLKIESEFRYEEKMLTKNFQEFQRDSFDCILTAIQITQISMELPIAKSGSSRLTCGVYDFMPLISVHEQVSQQITQEPNKNGKSGSQVRTGCWLVKKTSVSEEVMADAVKNECNFLIYMKSKICPYLGKYYCSKNILPFADGHIYIQYYPTSLDQTRLRLEGKLKILEDVCMGLLFMAKEELLHRDLKEPNIMVDRSKRARLIDFGSAAPFYGSDKFKLHDTRLRSTHNYFITYSHLCKSYPTLANTYTKEEYYRHPNFDMYSLGRIIYNEFSLEMIVEEGDFVRHFLHYLSQRCLEADPVRRWPIGQVLCFLRQLMLYFQQQKRFWKHGFEEHCRAHLIGSTVAIKEFSNEERVAQQLNLKRK